MGDLADQLLRQWSYLDNKAWNHKNLWQQTADLLDPIRNNVVQQTSQGIKQTTQIFDSTGIDALEKMISAVAEALFPPVWFRLKKRGLVSPSVETEFWLEDSRDRMLQGFMQSNFRKMRRQMLRSILTFGCGSFFVEERHLRHAERARGGFRGFEFHVTPIGHFLVTEDASHRLYSHWRDFMMTPEAMATRWPNSLPRAVAEVVGTNRQFDERQMIHVVRPGSNKAMPWDSFYVDVESRELVSARRFHEMPFQFARYDKAAHETYGRGPTQTAMPEIATANRARQLKLRQWALQVNPPLQTLDDGVIGKTKLIPGGLNTVRVLDAIKPIDVGGRFDHTAIPEQESKLQIRQMFMTEQLLQFAPLAKTPPSATEVLQRLKFLQQLLGSPVGSIQDEWLSPMIDRTFAMMLREGAFLPVPQELLEGDGNLDIEYEGPLARIQRQDELQGINDLLAIVAGVAQIDPQVIDLYDFDMIGRDLIAVTGVSPKYRRSDEDVEGIRQQRAEQQQAAQQQQAMLAAGQVAKDVGSAEAALSQAGQAA